MRPTPDTDAAVINFEFAECWLGGEIGSNSKEIIEPDFARKLERQRDELARVLTEISLHLYTSQDADRYRAMAQQALATKEDGV